MLFSGGVIIWVATAGVSIKQSKQMESGTEQKNKTISRSSRLDLGILKIKKINKIKYLENKKENI